MKKIALMLVIGLSLNLQAANEEVPKRSLQKTKEVLTSEPACVIYGILIGVSIGAGGMFLIKEMLSKKTLQEEHEKIWRPGEKIAQAIESNKVDDAIKNYVDEVASMIYAIDDRDKSDRKVFMLNDTVLTKILGDIQKEKDEATHNNQDIEPIETKAFAKLEQYSNVFKQLYRDMCGYNYHLVSNDKKAWDVQLVENEENEEYVSLVVGVYVNPPVTPLAQK